MTRLLLAMLLATSLTSVAGAQSSKNLLFYGNSYSFFNSSVPALVQLIAIEAGHASPTVVPRLVGGVDLQYHATDPVHVAAISNSLPPGQAWDFVVMQGQSLEPTVARGNPAQFRASATAIMSNVRNHSPAARGVLYQTWARVSGHNLYPATFASPLAMHSEIRDNYRLAVGDIEAAHGAGAAMNSAVGDGVALLEWSPAYYNFDGTHPGPAMTLLASMCIYTTIYDQAVCEIAPDFSQPSTLVLNLASNGLGEADWHAMAAIADRCADPAVRPYPGSGDHLLLESGTLPAPINACGSSPLSANDVVAMRFRSINGVYSNAPAWLLVDLFPTGSPPGPAALYPEIQVSLGTMSILMAAASLTTPLSLQVQVPFSWPGTSILVQGLAWRPSAETGNSFFTTTDAHVFVFQ